MIADVTLRWVVTILFALSAAECLLAIGAGRHTPVARVSHGVHLVMAVAMGLMAWPRGTDLPTMAPMVFFLIAGVWFAVVTVGAPLDRDARITNGYHAVMMAAMSWMYAVMNGSLLPGQSSEGHAHHQTHQSMHHSSGEVEHSPDWITTVNWAWMVGFTAATVAWLYRYFAARQSDRGPITLAHLELLRQTMMAAGMGIMFAVMA